MPDITTVINNIWRPYHGDLIKAFQLLTPEWGMLRNLEDWDQLSEREVKWPVDLKFGGGVHATVDGGSPARSLSKSPEEATESWATFARRFSVSLAVQRARTDSKMRRSKIEEQIAYQTTDAMDSFKKRMAISYWGFEDNILALVDSVAGAPTYTLKDRYGRTGVDVTTDLFTPGVDYLAIIDPGGPTERGRQQVDSVNPATPSVTLAAAIAGAATGDYVVFANALDTTAGENDLDRGFPGLLAHIHNTSLHGISGGTFEEWNPGLVEDKAGAALDEADLYEAFQTANRRSPHTIDMALTTVGVVAAAGGAQLDKRRYDADPGTVNLGFDKLKTMGVEVDVSEFAPNGYFVADARSSLMKFSPDSTPFSVGEGSGSTTKDFGGDVSDVIFHYAGDALGHFADIVFRAGMVRKSRRSLVAYHDVLEN